MFPANHNYIFLSFHFTADTGPECWPISSPFFRFFFFVVFEQSFLLRCRVPTVSFQGLQSLNQSWWVTKIVHRQWAFFSNASTSENTNATILCHLKWMLFQIQCLCPHYNEAKVPQTGLTYFILRDSKFGSLWGIYSMGESLPPPDPSIAVFCPGKDNFLKFCSDKRGWDGFCNIWKVPDMFLYPHSNSNLWTNSNQFTEMTQPQDRSCQDIIFLK